jgi:hypothetical protein
LVLGGIISEQEESKYSKTIKSWLQVLVAGSLNEGLQLIFIKNSWNR